MSLLFPGGATALPSPQPDGMASDHLFMPMMAQAGGKGFGSSIAVGQDVLATWARMDGPQGAVHVYRRIEGSGEDGPWQHEASIYAPESSSGLASLAFGSSIALDGDTLVIGEPSYGDRRGTVHVYEYNGSTWEFVTNLEHLDDRAGDEFGSSIALDDDRLVVSAPYAMRWDGASWDQIMGCGSISVFTREDGEWNLAQTMYSDTPMLNEYGDQAEYLGFAQDMALEDDRLAVSHTGPSCVYVFEDDGSGFVKRSTFSEDVYSLSLSGDRILIGRLDAWGASLWQLDGADNWVSVGDLAAGDDGANCCVAIEGDVAALTYLSVHLQETMLAQYSVTADGLQYQWDFTLRDDYGVSVASAQEAPVEIRDGSVFFGDPASDRFGIDTGSVVELPQSGCNTGVSMNGVLEMPAPGVLLNDGIAAGESVVATLVAGAAHGTVELGPDGSFVYTPDEGYYGIDRFIYSLVGEGVSPDPVSVQLNVWRTDYISGVVRSTDGLPLEGIVVRISSVSSVPPNELHPGTMYAITDSLGRYEFVNVPLDDYYVVYSDVTDVYRDQHLWASGLKLEDSPYLSMVEGGYYSGLDAYMVPLADSMANRTERVSGPNRYATSIAASNMRESASHAVLTNGASYPDALSAAPLAGMYKAPILLTGATQVPVDVMAELTRLDVGTVFIVGGEAVVSESVEDQLVQAGYNVRRFAGDDRYETSERVVQYICSVYRSVDPFVVRGDDFADALSVAPFAWMQVRPIILVRPTGAPNEATRAFKSCGTDTVIIAGGTAAVSDQVLDDFMDYERISTINYYRFAGSNRYETSAISATAWGVPFDYIGLASGLNYPDALSGAASMGYFWGPILLTPPDALCDPAGDVIFANGSYLWEVYGFGGEAALAPTVLMEAHQAAGPECLNMLPYDTYSGFLPVQVGPLSAAAPLESGLPQTERLSRTR